MTKKLTDTYRLIVLLSLMLTGLNSFAQVLPLKADSTHTIDTSIRTSDTTLRFINADTVKKQATTISSNAKIDSILKYHSPAKAAFRSAIVPGLGQIYNQKYWKLPIIYGALGISASVFVYNLKWYRRTRFAYTALVNQDTAAYQFVHPQLQGFIKRNDAHTLQSYRNEFRQSIDYSVLFFMLIWGLNVVDATVDAHLKSFDVSPDLSFKVKFGQSQMAGTNGVSLVLAFK